VPDATTAFSGVPHFVPFAFTGDRAIGADGIFHRALPRLDCSPHPDCRATSIGHERAPEHWIEIPVPALVSEESFARAQKLLHENKKQSRRRTITPRHVTPQMVWSPQKTKRAPARVWSYSVT
jgi:hypothetical protein